MNSDDKRPMSDTERAELAAKLDANLDDFINNLKRSKYKDGWKEDTWEEEMQQHPFFRTKPFGDDEELPPLIQGLRDIKYDPETNTDEELAATFKEDGNLCFKVKKYRHAVDNYTEGLRKRHSNTELITQLLTNRAAAHFHLGNFRSSLRDCERALSVTPDHMKAIVRGVQCCSQLRRYQEALTWCDRGLVIQPDHEQLVQLRHTAENNRRVEERNRRQEALKERRQKAEDDKLLQALRSRDVRLLGPGGSVVCGGGLRPELLTPQVPGVERGVHFSEDGSTLVWPLLFLYPEHSQSDLVQAAPETDTLYSHLLTMFDTDGAWPEWDPGRAYRPDRLELYFETDDGLITRLVPVPPHSTVADVLADNRYVVKCGVPGLMVLVKGSEFRSTFLSRYQLDRR